MLEAIIARLNNSACGLDGVINAGWKPVKRLAASILWLVLCHMCSTGLAPWDFNDVLNVFVPKKIFEE
eukprot:6551582-Karenia_brevis.AAC.1